MRKISRFASAAATGRGVAECVDVIDPGWGRDDLLWSTVQAALTDRPVRRFFLEPGPGEACTVHA